MRSKVLVSAVVIDDCALRVVKVEVDVGAGFRGAARLRDDGRRGDAVAGDGRFTGTIRLRPKQARDIAVRVVARNKAKLGAAGPTAVIRAR